jgi:pyruvate/2-oxoglutarate dehydrogenase complex dihydrolipoamide dehydrogenase (E3) component
VATIQAKQDEIIRLDHPEVSPQIAAVGLTEEQARPAWAELHLP